LPHDRWLITIELTGPLSRKATIEIPASASSCVVQLAERLR
jgi:hypothetical protein